jgi:3-hydroxyisobutyrate dehydrogenase
MTAVGLVGTGRMGLALGERLLGAGYALTVHNRTPAKAEPLLAAGARWAASPAKLTRAADVVLTIVTDDAAVDSTYRGPDGLLSGSAEDRLFIEMSTVRTATVHRLHASVHAAGGRMVDAPLSGPPAAARAGQLLVLAGGTDANVAEATPYLSAFARRVVHLGPAGAGTTMKLVQTMPMGIFFAGLAEALAIGTQLGLDRRRMLDVFLDSQAAPPILRDRVARLFGEEGPPGFDVAGVRKDLQAMVATAQDAGVAASTAAAALGLYAAATAAGWAERDLIHIVEYVGEQARLVQPRPHLS